MAAETGSTSAVDRRFLLAALALLGATTGIVFGRVFVGTHPAVRLAVAGLAATLIAALMARRHIGLSLGVSAAGLLLVLGILVFPGTTWLGLPAPRTISAIVDALGVVTDRAATEVAPAPPLAPLMTASMMAVWSAATAAHALAVRSGSALLPLLPAAALLGFAGVVTEEPPRPGYVVLFLGSAFTILFAEAMQRTRSWGAARSERGVFSGRWARILGGGAAAAAIAIPAILPGFGDAAVVEIEGGGERIGVTPIVDIRPSLLQNPAADLFTVRSSRPSYWRLVVLDEFDGRLWKPSETPEGGLEPLSEGFDQLTSQPAPRQRFLEQQVEIQELATPWLPVAADPVSIELEDDLGATHDLRTNVLEVESETSDGMTYRVTSAQTWPTLRTLEDMLANNPLGDPRYTMLPPETPERIREIALDVAGRSETMFKAVLAIQNYLRSFTYDESAPPGHGINDMIHFLDVSRRGYCEQFAGTMAVLVRSLGIPARVAIGFLPGERDETGRFQVTTAQVHAWPEVHFGEYGWLAFEPTPGRNNPSASYLLPPSLRTRTSGGPIRGGDDASGSLSSVEQRESFQPILTETRPPEEVRAVRRERPFAWRRLVAIGLGIAAAIAVLTVPLRAVGRRIRLRSGADGRDRVLEAYSWLLDGTSALKIGRKPGETPLEFGTRLRDERGVSTPALSAITGMALEALYSPRGPGRERGDVAVASTREVLRELRRQAGPLRTLAGAVRPRS